MSPLAAPALPTPTDERFLCRRLHCVLKATACVARQDARSRVGPHSVPVHRECAPEKLNGPYPCAQGREVRAALLELATRPPPEPTIEIPKEEPMERKKSCEQCGRRLRQDSKHGRCWYCRSGEAPKPRAASVRVEKASELPPVETLPPAYLARCVAEAKRRVAGIDELVAALKGAA